MTVRPIRILAVVIFWLSGLAPGAGAASVQGPELSREEVAFFERRIRPVLVEKCYSCHSQAAGKAEGGLRLDTAEGLRKGGDHGEVIVPGESAKSRFVTTLQSGHPPSTAAGRAKPLLSHSAIADLVDWVKMGAPDPRFGGTHKAARSPDVAAARNHWAFRPVQTPPLPRVRESAWVKDPLDGFVLSGLEVNQLRPAPAADRATLIRRASFDLMGMPPTLQEIEAFLADESPTAFAKVVDRLLDSRQFGERWAGHWLHQAGYADLGWDPGIVYENAWRYRDYVINAFNADKPYDAFVREQLAGDLLGAEDDPQPAALTATGFLLVGSRLRSGVNRSELVLDIADEQIDLTSRAFLGLTVACARCHDHKSDPISLRDYYGLAGIFTSTASLADAADAGRRGALRWRERSLASPAQLRAVSEFESRFSELKQQLQEAREMKLAFPGEIDSTQLAGVVVDNLAAEVHGAWKESNYSTNFVDRDYLHDANADKGRKSARFVPDLPAAGRYNVLVSYTPRANRATNVPVTITSQEGTKTVYLDQTLAPTVDKVFSSVGSFAFAAGTGGSVLLSNEGTKGFVVVDAVRFVPADAKGNLALPEPGETSPEAALLNYRQLEKEVLEFRFKRPVLPQAMAVEEGRIRDCRIRSGGDPGRAGEEVPRGFLSALGIPESTFYAITDESSGRLELAHWIAAPENPLTARVAVNRVWWRLIGQGLVRTTDDFGRLGEPPSHPQLLDHLAKRFIDQGGSLKQLIRSIMLSSTYQMDSASNPAGLERDPENRLIWRANPGFLDPGTVRDAILSLSRELDPSFGGSWLPEGTVHAPSEPSARRLQTESRRRSIYLPVTRTVPEVFRLLNDPVPLANLPPPSAAAKSAPNRFLSDRARVWADVLLRLPAATETERIALAYREALGRAPSARETAAAIEWLRANPRGTGTPAPNPAGWETFCYSLLSSAEFRTRR